MSKPLPQVSPLDKLSKSIKKGTLKSAWDLEDEDPALRFRLMQFLRNLVENTSPDTKLAYQIAHYMEANYLELPGLDKDFPANRRALKEGQKADLNEKKDMAQGLREARAELRDLRSGLRQAPGDKALEGAVKQAEEAYNEMQKEAEAFEKISEYKDQYPLKSDAHSLRKGAKPEDWDALKAYLKKKTTRRPSGSQASNFMRNTELLCDHLGFSQLERDALMVILISDEDSAFSHFLENLIGGRQKNAHALFAKMVGVEREAISDVFRANSPLVEKGIIIPVSDLGPAENDESAGKREVIPVVTNHLTKVLREPDLTLESMMRQFVGEPAKTHLDWDRDFAYLGEQGDQLIKLLQGARETGMAGVNVLLYGLPGTGKTEAIKAAAAKAGLELYIVGERTRFGQEPTRNDRLSAAILAQEMLADKPNAAIMLDEMEDMFPAQMSLSSMFGQASNDNSGDDEDKEPTGASKVYLNRLLEKNKTICLWAANKPEKFDPAFRRRMIYSIEFRVPPADVRTKIWGNVAARHQFALSAEQQRALGSEFVVAPGLMENAIRHARLSKGGIEAIRGNLRAASTLLFNNRRAIDARDPVSAHYDLRFINPSVEHNDFNLEEIARNIKESGRRKFSMLLYGVPGTGKTEFFAWMANYLEMDVMVVDASQINDKYWGETEKKIVEAFAEAEDRQAFLVMDECDTLLRRRQDLGSNHEKTAVGLMLQCMQRHTMPFGCTTNLFEDIDAAAKRRFLFKVAFNPLTAAQNHLAFEHFFGRPCPPEMARLSGLAPSDFVAVREQSGLIPGVVSDERYLRLLQLESRARMEEGASPYSGSTRGPGFGTTHTTLGSGPRHNLP